MQSSFRLFPALLCMMLFPVLSSAQDTLVYFGSSSVWKYRDGGVNLDADPWKTLAYSEPSWSSGPAALGFGTNPPPMNTTINGGPSGGRYPTVYFRKIINIPSANLSAYTNIKLQVKFDDGVVVWLNGSEVYRNNVPAGQSYSTFASSAITNNGADIYTQNLTPAQFSSGDNIIAVELHQVNVTSSDLHFDLQLIGLSGTGASITRNPYLQVGKQTGVTIRWKTDIACNSRVRYGTTQGSLTAATDSNTVTTDHEVTIGGLNPDTRYYYEVGEFSGAVFTKHQGASDNFFNTLPPANTSRTIRIAAFGDCGRNDYSYQTNTLAALKNYEGYPGSTVDAWLLLGDNAYNAGTDTEYDNNFFAPYGTSILKNHFLYPAPGNHDYANLNANRTLRNLPYYNNFKMPANGECGGVASNTEAYYSFDIGNVHFLSLDSYGKEGTKLMSDTSGAQTNWIKQDLAANNKKFTVAYWHHPPITFGSHTSDAETDLQAIRDSFITILERYGVDIILCGHSHAYERSYLLKGFYGQSNTFNKAVHTADSSSGKYDGTTNSCAYSFASGKVNHGTVYVVAGSSGAGTASTYSQFGSASGSHPFSLNTGGCFIIEVQGNRLDAKFLKADGAIGDRFTIMKDVKRYTDTTIGNGQSLTLSASWNGGYNWINNGGLTTKSITFTPPVGTNIYRVVDSTGSKTCLKDSFRVVVAGVLPLSIRDFNAISKDANVQLIWEVLQDNGTGYFSVERSVNGVDFTPLARIYSAPVNSGLNRYSFTDEAPLTGTSFYRLLYVSPDGTIHPYITRKVNRVTLAHPHDFRLDRFDEEGSVLHFSCAGNTSLQLLVTDISGRKVLVEKINALAGENSHRLHLQQGVYVVELSAASGKTESRKIWVW